MVRSPKSEKKPWLTNEIALEIISELIDKHKKNGKKLARIIEIEDYFLGQRKLLDPGYKKALKG